MVDRIRRVPRRVAVVLMVGSACTGLVYASPPGNAEVHENSRVTEESGWLGPIGVSFERRGEVLEQLRVSAHEVGSVVNSPVGTHLPDLKTVADQVHDLFELWWYGDEWSFAEFREQRGLPTSVYTGMQNHQELFLETVAAVRESAVRMCDARIIPWMIEGVRYERELGDRPRSSGSLLGTILPAMSELEEQGASMIDLVVPIRVDAFNKREQQVRCEATLELTMMWDADAVQWEVVTVAFSSYPRELSPRFPPF